MIQKLYRPAFLLGWIALLFLIATNIQVGWLYVIIAFFLLLVMLSFIYPSRLVRRVRVVLRVPDLVECFTAVSAEIEVENRGFFPAHLVDVSLVSDAFRAEPSHITFVHIPRRKKVHMSIVIRPVRRGIYPLGALKIKSGSPIGMYYSERRIPLPDKIAVHPRLLPPDEVESEMSEHELGVLRRGMYRLLTDPFFYQLREGTPAESMTAVHWKLTAKRDTLIIKLRERKRTGTYTIVVDDIASHYSDRGEAFEKLLERAVSLARKLVMEEVPVALRGIAAPPVYVETQAAWEDALLWSAKIQLTEDGWDTKGVDWESMDSGEVLVFSPRC